ncbi:MAG: ABA4-like family protein [Caldilineales bacterium]|nr:ABA4-like family protein [Caldilineales bacterium]MDW8317934.1 ABA4-like family protein [Anaerolineae bacterium]
MDKFFSYLNAFPMPLWLGMMFAPRAKLTQQVSRSSVVFGLAAFHYVAALGLAVLGGRRSQSPVSPTDFTSLEGIRKGLSTREGALAAWSHMLALDLFTGAWIYREAMRLAAPAWVRIPALALTLMAGPFGLLLFLIWRTVKTGPALSD